MAKTKHILDVEYNNHRISIDEVELNWNEWPEGGYTVTDTLITVARYDGDDVTFLSFNVAMSCINGDMELVDMAKAWIDIGCPSNNGREWYKDTLATWTAGQ